MCVAPTVMPSGNRGAPLVKWAQRRTASKVSNVSTTALPNEGVQPAGDRSGLGEVSSQCEYQSQEHKITLVGN